MLTDELDILQLVLLCQLNLGSTGLEIVRFDDSKVFVLICKGSFESGVRDVILTGVMESSVWGSCVRGGDARHPSERLMQIRINQGHLQHPHRPPQGEFVDGRRKVGIEESTVEDGETDTATNEAEVVEVLGIDA